MARGAALLGSGGGGNVGVGLAVARRAGPAALVAAHELDPAALVIHVGLVGAPDIIAERLPSGDEFAAAARALEHHLRADADALGVIEIGGLNALMPFAAAGVLGLPIVDGDLMGRAFPRLDQTTLAAAGVAPGPIALVDSSGDLALLDSPSAAGLERMLRAVIPSVGGGAAIACYPVRADTLARHGIAGSVSRALALEASDGEVLFAGRVAEIRRDAHIGSVVLEDPKDVSEVARIDMGDEYLAVTVNGEPVAQVPDIICLLDGGHPVGTEELRAGRHVHAVRIEPPPALHALPDSLVGPAAFGL